MGSQIPRGSSDPSGANWTPAMETYFIDLLLDQLHRGNRMGYTSTNKLGTKCWPCLRLNLDTLMM